MTDTIGPVPARIDQQQLAQKFVEAARADGLEPVGPLGRLGAGRCLAILRRLRCGADGGVLRGLRQAAREAGAPVGRVRVARGTTWP